MRIYQLFGLLDQRRDQRRDQRGQSNLIKSVKTLQQAGLVITVLVSSVSYAASPVCEPETNRNLEVITGAVAGGEEFTETTPGGWIFKLTPMRYGWLLGVAQPGREDENISRLTPPLHGPNATLIEGWHFRNETNTGPNTGSVNVPQQQRHFIFSPEVGRTINYNGASTTGEDIDTISSYGRGWLYLDSFALTPLKEGERASFETISFKVCLTWPR